MNAPLMPEGGGGGPGVSNDWCITRVIFERDIIFFLAKVFSEASGPMQVDPI